MNDSVLLDVKDDVAYVTLNAPPLNILTIGIMQRLSEVLARVAADATLKAVAVTANGKAFSAGADVGEHQPEQAPAMIAAFSALFEQLHALEIPIVMLVDGAAFGAGFELVLLADVLLATERAKFAQPEIRLGFIAPVGIAALPALVGRNRAIEITSSGRTYSAEEMLAFGLVSKLVPSAEARVALEAVLGDFRKASPLILRMNVRTLKRLANVPFEQAHKSAEAVFLGELMATADVREGIASFMEKRSAVWQNR